MSNKRKVERSLFLDDDDDNEDKFYRLKVLLPNSTSVTLTLTNPEPKMPLKNFVNLVKEEYDKTRKNCELSGKKRKRVDWNLAAKSYLEFNDEKIKEIVRFKKFNPDLCNIIRLDDGSGEASIMYENMWDLTPDTDLLKELPQTYSFETALADLIDNSLQAVWSCSPGDRRLISVDVLGDRISIFDSGPGMDSSEANSIDKWGKIGASMHRSHKSEAIGGNPPYLKPFFGIFGYGAAYACMHLGRRTVLSSKTKQSTKVWILQLNQEDLIGNHSISGKTWKTDGGMRYPSEEEMKLSPHGSFTKRVMMCISPDCKVVRVHTVMKRKEMSWKRGQQIKILKGACAGVHKNDVYATIDYFLIEGFDDEAGGDARIICRQINYSEDEGCMLSISNGVSRLEIRSSSSFPISIIDSGKCQLLDANEWNKKLDKQREKNPSRIDLLDERDCRALNFNGESSVGDSVHAGETPPNQIVAVVRPASFSSSKVLKKLDQKHIVKMDGDMLMEVKFEGTNMKSRDKNAEPLYSHNCFPRSRGGLHGLYIFPLESKFPNMFKKAGIYNFCFSTGNSITTNKKVVVRPSSKVGSWKLASNLESMWQCNVRVGSSLPPCAIACYDEYENQIPFSSVPSLEVELKASHGLLTKIDMIEANLIDHGILKVENMLVETGGLDQIRPDYEAILEICSKDEPFSVSVACKVNPGPLKHVGENNPQALGYLLPGSTVENYILEMFDGYNNHVAEGTKVQMHIDGYCIQDSIGLNRKVNSSGCVDLSGILKVTAGYGKSVSILVMSGNEEIFKKMSLTERRELRLLTELPKICAAGSTLTNLIFKVTDSDGSMDTSIHHDEKSGCFHMMSIESDSSGVESAIKYTFIDGCCKVPSLSLPDNEGVFSFKVFHSRYPELHINLKIQLSPAQTFERDEIGFSTPYSRMTLTPQSKMASTTNPLVPPTQQTPHSQFKVLTLRASSSALSSQTGLMDMEQFTENLKEKLIGYSAHRVEVDERLKCFEAEQEQAEQELSTLKASLEPLGTVFTECLSTKESIMKQIEEKHHDTAASAFCCLYRNAPPPKSLFLSKKGMFGLVSLLGSVASTSLSRVLAEYLGEDTMLALVCKSSNFGPSSADYLWFQSKANKLGRSISNRFHVLCLDAMRDGLLEEDPQKKLAMDDPKLPNGDPIPGFKGYAVNMIDMALPELHIQTYLGHGLRETLFYDLFGKLQVYETQKQVEAALPHIIGGGAVSLDGFIAKENGFIYSGRSNPQIHFPITLKENEAEKLRKLEAARNRVKMTAKKIEEEKCSLQKLDKKLKKTNENIIMQQTFFRAKPDFVSPFITQQRFKHRFGFVFFLVLNYCVIMIWIAWFTL